MPDKWGKPCHVHAVRCPHCGKPNDFREVGDALLEGDKQRPTVECDHCKGVIQVVKVQQATLVWVTKWSGATATTQKKKTFTVWKCQKCNGEHYGPRPKLIDRQQRPRCALLTAERDANGRQKPCAGLMVKQVVTEEVGDRHRVLEASSRVFKCIACSAEFYDRGFTINDAGQHLCTCGEPLIQQ